MEIRIAQKLKELRKERGNTQEELAAFLGITVQAVSKWERAEGMPDITYLPRIAGFYGVSVDTLLGVDEAAKEERTREIRDAYAKIHQQEPTPDGRIFLQETSIREGIKLLREALREIPDSYSLMQLLASDLWKHAQNRTGEEKTALLDEAEDLCRKILRDCREENTCHCAREILCLVLFDQGNKKQSVEMAYSMPDATGSNDYMLTRVLEGEELQRQLHIAAQKFIMLAEMSVRKLQDNGFGTDFLREQGYLRLRLDSIYSALYGEH